MASCHAAIEPLAVSVMGMSRMAGWITVTLSAGLGAEAVSAAADWLLRPAIMPMPISTIKAVSKAPMFSFCHDFPPVKSA